MSSVFTVNKILHKKHKILKNNNIMIISFENFKNKFKNNLTTALNEV
jgi:hypothetical protein